jgi:hypothetical protein
MQGGCWCSFVRGVVQTTGAIPLYIACQNGHAAVAELLLDRGAAVNQARVCCLCPVCVRVLCGGVPGLQCCVELQSGAGRGVQCLCEMDVREVVAGLCSRCVESGELFTASLCAKRGVVDVW